MGFYIYGEYHFETKQVPGKKGLEVVCSKIIDHKEAFVASHYANKTWLDRDIQNELIEQIDKLISVEKH